MSRYTKMTMMIYILFNRSAISFVCVNLTWSNMSMMPITSHETSYSKDNFGIWRYRTSLSVFVFVNQKKSSETQKTPIAKAKWNPLQSRLTPMPDFFSSCALRLLKWLKAWLIEPKKKLNTINPGQVFKLLWGGEHNHKLCFTRWILLANSFWCSGILFSVVSGHNRFVAKLVCQGNNLVPRRERNHQPSGGS